MVIFWPNLFEKIEIFSLSNKAQNQIKTILGDSKISGKHFLMVSWPSGTKNLFWKKQSKNAPKWWVFDPQNEKNFKFSFRPIWSKMTWKQSLGTKKAPENNFWWFGAKMKIWEKKFWKVPKMAKKSQIFEISKFEIRPISAGNRPICGRKVGSTPKSYQN